MQVGSGLKIRQENFMEKDREEDCGDPPPAGRGWSRRKSRPRRRYVRTASLHRYPDCAKLFAASVFRRNVVFRNFVSGDFPLFGIGSTFHAAHHFGLIGLAFLDQFRDTLGIGVGNR